MNTIISAFTDIVKVLNSLQPDSERSESNQQVINDQLQNNIKRIVSNHLHDYFPID